MKIYTEYKKTNFSILKKIPAHWSLKKMKFITNIYTGDSLNDNYKTLFESDDKAHLAYISSKDINVDTSEVQYENGLRIPLDYGKFKIAPKNSALLCIEGGSAGRKMAFANQDVHFVNKLACFNSVDPITSKFIFYSLKSDIFQAQFFNSITGLIGGVSISNLKNFYLSIPTLSEQIYIVRFLDNQIAIIDDIIQRKGRLIELLKEKQQSIINEVVTKGLNPNAKMKESGIEWLGEIPEDWRIVRLRFLGKCQNGVSQSGDYFGTGDPFVSYGDVYKNDALPDFVKGLAESSESDKENYSVLEGDVLFTRTSETIEEIGLSSVCLSTIENAVFAGFLIRFRPYRNLLFKGYSRYFFRSLVPRVHFVKEMNLVTRASLSQELLKSLPVCLPNLDEQKIIASFLDGKVLQISELVQNNVKAIEKLKEYRQSLISEVVTGKIDVRDWQPNKTV